MNTFLKVFIAVSLVMVPISAAYAEIDADLVAYYPFDGNANDASGNGHDGTCYGGIAYSTGIVGQAAVFDGLNDYIMIFPSGELVAQDTISVAAWINPVTIFGGPRHFDIYVQNDTDYSYVTHNVTIDDGLLYYDNFLPWAGATTTPVTENQWQHIAVVRSDDLVQIYIDGQLATTGTGEPREAASDIDNTLVGARVRPHLDHLFHGAIDDLRIYSRPLTEAEIQQLYKGGIPPKEIVEELVNTVISINLQGGISNSLDSKLDVALSCLDDMNENNDIAAINSLNAFINAVKAQSGQNIPAADADALIAEALFIIDLLQAE
jgi:hypothetical protein